MKSVTICCRRLMQVLFTYRGHKVMRQIRITILILFIILFYPLTPIKAETQKRAMTFSDIIEMRQSRRGDISPDGKWFIYSFSVPDWTKNNIHSDIYVTPIGGKTKQMTFSKGININSLQWYKDSSIFAFLSGNQENKTQIFFMHRDRGEAWKITDDSFGVSSYKWSKDFKYLSYLGGESEQRQVWIMPGDGGVAEKLTNHKTPISSYLWNPNNNKLYFTAIDSIDLLDNERKEKGFNVIIKDEIKIPFNIWEFDIESKEEKQLTNEIDYSVSNISISEDGTKIAFIGTPTKRYSTYTESEIYLLDLNTNRTSRVTNNSQGESHLSFSPDSKWLAFISPDGQDHTVKLKKIYLYPTEGGETKELLHYFDYEAYINFWSEDSRSIYFTAGVGVNYHLFSVSIDNDKIEQITNFGNYSFFFKDKDSKRFFMYYSDPTNPRDYYYSKPENFNVKDQWIRLTDSNPQMKDFKLGEYETIKWTSSDSMAVEGILIKPINYKRNRKYPLIVQIHGGPHDVYDNRFSASWGDYVHIYSANGYVVFQPNYRGSTGYGQKFKNESMDDYFRLPFDDIMTGVDFLINKSIVHPDSMGIMGWSAGGEYSNWALVSTDRFKAISSGAGTVTFYDWEDDFESDSPLKYIKNAKTPTLIQFGENDPIMPPRHGEILYRALKKLGVPTEFILYPNTGHIIRDMRYQMIKMQAEFNWFEKWIRGKERWMDWNNLIETLEEE